MTDRDGGSQDADRRAANGRAAAIAVFIVFALSGVNFSSWAARLPAVRDGLDFTPNQMGLLLLVGALFSVAALPLSGMIVEAIGAKRTVQISAGMNTGGLILGGVGVTLGSVWITVAGLVVYGVGTAVWDAAMNLEGAAAEQELKRSLMPRFHAGFSFGTMAGAGIGAGAAALHVPIAVHLGVVLSLSMVTVLWATRSFLPEGTHDAHPDDRAARGTSGAFNAWREPRTLLIGVVILAAALTEGAANDWVSLAVVDGFGTTNATGAVAFAVFVTAMTGMRLLGTALLDRWGRVVVLRIASGLALVGLLVFGLVPWFWLALVGIVAWGMGAALGFPVGMSAAADDPRRAPARVAVVATIGYSAFLAGPPLLGLLANQVGYRTALLAITIPVVAGLFAINAARPLPTAAPTMTMADPAVTPPTVPPVADPTAAEPAGPPPHRPRSPDGPSSLDR